MGSAFTNCYYSIEWEDWLRRVVGMLQSTAELYMKLGEVMLYAVPWTQGYLSTRDQKWRSWLQSQAWAGCSPCAGTQPHWPRPYFLVMGPGQLQHRHKVSFCSLLSTASVAGLPVPSPSPGKALRGDNSQLFHIPCLKTLPRFVAVVYAHHWKQQGRLSSALAVLPPSSFL